MDIIRWFWMQLICIFEAFKKKPPVQTTETESDPLRWIQPKHKWAWMDRSLEIHALHERISEMKPHSTLRTMVTYNDEVHHMYVWVGNVFVGFTTVDHKGTLFCAEGNDIQLHAEYEYAGYIDSVEKLTTKSHWSDIRSSMLEAFRAKLQRRMSIWQVACSNGIMLRTGYPVLTGLVHSVEEIRNFPDAANHGLRKLFAVGVTPAAACYQPLKKLLSGPLGKRLRLTDVSLIRTLRLEWIKALAAARNAGSLRKVIQRACAQLGIPEMRSLDEYKRAMLMHQEHGFVWVDAIGNSSFHHWMAEHVHLVRMGFNMPFGLKEMINAWKEFRYHDFFRMGDIIDLTLQQTVGAQAFSEADVPVVHARILKQCGELLPEHRHYIVNARHLHSLGKKMNFCVGYYKNQVEARSYVVVVSKKRGEDTITTGFVLSGGLMRYQQAHIKNNAVNSDCKRMMDFQALGVATNNQALTVSYPTPESIQQLRIALLSKIARTCFYKDKRGKIRVYPHRKWAERHLQGVLEFSHEIRPRLKIRAALQNLPI